MGCDVSLMRIPIEHRVTPEYATIRMWAIIGLVIYPLGVPLTYFLLLSHERAAIALGKPGRGTLAHALRLLWSDYEPSCWYWEVCELARKVTLVGFFALILILSLVMSFQSFVVLILNVQVLHLTIDTRLAPPPPLHAPLPPLLGNASPDANRQGTRLDLSDQETARLCT